MTRRIHNASVCERRRLHAVGRTMTWLFVRFYLCVLIVLALAWYINGTVLKRRTEAEWERVIVAAHGGGAACGE